MPEIRGSNVQRLDIWPGRAHSLSQRIRISELTNVLHSISMRTARVGRMVLRWGGRLACHRTTYTKSRYLLDFWRGAQASRLCAAVCSFGSDGYGARKWTSLHTAETAMPPSFVVKSPISKRLWYYPHRRDARATFRSPKASCFWYETQRPREHGRLARVGTDYRLAWDQLLS